MSTIAFKDGIVVADTQTDWGNRKIKSLKKIVDHGDIVVAGSGDADDRHLNALFMALDNSEDFPTVRELKDLPQEFVALVFTRKTKQVFLVQTGENAPFILEIKDKFFAIGSGGDYAMGAMAAGASAKEAVRISCMLDIHSNKPIQEVKLW